MSACCAVDETACLVWFLEVKQYNHGKLYIIGSLTACSNDVLKLNFSKGRLLTFAEQYLKCCAVFNVDEFACFCIL